MVIKYLQTDDDEERTMDRASNKALVSWIEGRVESLGLELKTISVRRVYKNRKGKSFFFYEVVQEGVAEQIGKLIAHFPEDSSVNVT